MSEIEQFLRSSIEKNTGVLIEKMNDNILELEVSPLDLLYVIIDIEKNYRVPAKEILNNITPDSFTIKQISMMIAKGN